MPKSNGLLERWSAEIDRMVPKPDPFDLSGIVNIVAEWIRRILKKIFGSDFNLQTPEAKTALIIIYIFIAVVCVTVVFFVWRYYGKKLRTMYHRVIKPENGMARKNYRLLVAQKKYTDAFRYLVIYISQRTGLASRTFRELFSFRSNADVGDIAVSYGRAVHCDDKILKSDLERLEAAAEKSFPEITPVIKVKSKDRSK